MVEGLYSDGREHSLHIARVGTCGLGSQVEYVQCAYNVYVHFLCKRIEVNIHVHVP